MKAYGLRKETVSESPDFARWDGHQVCLRGTASGVLDGESYALVPFSLPGFPPGLYLGLGASFDTSTGVVTNEAAQVHRLRQELVAGPARHPVHPARPHA